jgi:hypothetical protein
MRTLRSILEADGVHHLVTFDYDHKLPGYNEKTRRSGTVVVKAKNKKEAADKAASSGHPNMKVTKIQTKW